METRICTKCNIEKSFNDYYKSKLGKNGLNSVCKSCYKEQCRKYEKDNPRYDYRSKRYQKIKPEHNKAVAKRQKERYQNDIGFRLLENTRSRILKAVKGIIKSENTRNLIGCDIETYKIYIESQFKPEMNWNNHGVIWEIDHIKPCASFNLLDPDQQKQCFHYTNTQPLFKTSELAEQFGYINERGNRNKSNKLK